MYGAHQKNINRHKSFHPLTYKNLAKVEQRTAEIAQKEDAKVAHAETLKREREEARYASLLQGDVQDNTERPLKALRLDTMIAASSSTHIAAAPTTGGATGASATTNAPAKTGTVTAEEREEMRKTLDRAKKERNDPLARVQRYENEVVAAAAARGLAGSGGQQQAGKIAGATTNTATPSSSSSISDLKARLLEKIAKQK